VIEKNLVDVFVPFLPLERRHVKICLNNELRNRGLEQDEQVVETVTDQLSYWPKDLRLYSSLLLVSPPQSPAGISSSVSYCLLLISPPHSPADISSSVSCCSGCKRVAQKIDLVVEEREEREEL